MRVFICGPMSGLPDYNYPAFHAEADRLRALGFEVESPANNVIAGEGSWQAYMRVSITQLVRSDCVRLLPGWEFSRGASLERRIAADLGLKVFMPDEAVS